MKGLIGMKAIYKSPYGQTEIQIGELLDSHAHKIRSKNGICYLMSELELVGKIPNTIDVELPKGFRNVGISLSNHLIANTNDSKNYDTLRFPLPKPNGKWSIKCYSNNSKIVTLIDKE